MAVLLDDASSELLYNNSTYVDVGYPMAMVGWYNSDDNGVGEIQTVCTSGDYNDDRRFLFAWNDGGTKYACLQEKNHGVNYGTARQTYAWNTGTWYHFAGICVSATDRRVILDGVNKATNSTSVTVTGPDSFEIGRACDSTSPYHASGKIAEVAVWDLSDYPGATDSDKADYWEAHVCPALAKRFSPDHFQLGLKNYWPLGGRPPSDLGDWMGVAGLSELNSPAWTDHLGMIYPSRQRIIVPVAAPPSVIATPYYYTHLLAGAG